MKKVALIDLDSVIFACFNGNKIPDGNGGWLRTEDGKRLLYTEKTPEEVIQACDDIFTMILTDCGADGYLAWIKGKDTIKDRLAVNPEYKQDRNQEQPKYWKLCSDHFVNKWGAHLANGLETDDVLNICKHAVPNSFLCCIDSDLLGTEGIHWNWKKKEWITSTKQTEEDNLYTDMIVGTHNNVKGLPKKGKKFAEKFLQENESFCRANALTELYIQAFGPDWTKEFDKNYKCIKLLTSKEGFEIPAPTKFEPVMGIPMSQSFTIKFDRPFNPYVNEGASENSWVEPPELVGVRMVLKDGSRETIKFPDLKDVLSERDFNIQFPLKEEDVFYKDKNTESTIVDLPQGYTHPNASPSGEVDWNDISPQEKELGMMFLTEIHKELEKAIPIEDILSENWFNTIGEADRTEEIPEF